MTQGFVYRVVAMGDGAILVIAGQRISNTARRRVEWALHTLRESARGDTGSPASFVTEWVPGYVTLLGRIGSTDPMAHMEHAAPLHHTHDTRRPVANYVVPLASVIAAELESLLNKLLCASCGALESTGLTWPLQSKRRVVDIPVTYGGEFGPDLAHVAHFHKLTEEEVVRLHAQAQYEVYLMGFTPGFPYLAGLPEVLETPRREHPRLQVPAGSVAIGGRQTGIYPTVSPGGWQVIGRTPLGLFDLHRDDPFLLHPGDFVHFQPLTNVPEMAESQAETETHPQDANHVRQENRPHHAVTFEVLDPGLLTTVQDGGRAGYGAQGVARCGPMDPYCAAIANLLVGNPRSAALVECTVVGARVRFDAECVVAVTGADMAPQLNGVNMPMWKSVAVPAGSELHLSAARDGCRAYVGVYGGIDVPKVMGSASTDLRQGFGGYEGRALMAGDLVGMGSRFAGGAVTSHEGGRESTRGGAGTVPNLHRYAGRSLPVSLRPTYTPSIEVGFLSTGAPSAVSSEVLAAAVGVEWIVAARSDRMGIGLKADSNLPGDHRQRVSEPVLMGTIQCPPGGDLIVLMADAQTVGGYPTLGVVCSSDLSKLAQARPGTRVRLKVVSEDEAREGMRRQQQVLRALQIANLAPG